MKAPSVIKKTMWIVWLGTPFFLMSFVLAMSLLKTAGLMDRSIETLTLWKYLRNKFYFVYTYGSTLPIFFILIQDEKTLKTAWEAFKPWIIGMVLTLFSYAIVGILVDLSWVLYYISIAITSGGR